MTRRKNAVSTHEDPGRPPGLDIWDPELSLEDNIELNRRIKTPKEDYLTDFEDLVRRLLPSFPL